MSTTTRRHNSDRKRATRGRSRPVDPAEVLAPLDKVRARDFVMYAERFRDTLADHVEDSESPEGLALTYSRTVCESWQDAWPLPPSAASTVRTETFGEFCRDRGLARMRGALTPREHLADDEHEGGLSIPARGPVAEGERVRRGGKR